MRASVIQVIVSGRSRDRSAMFCEDDSVASAGMRSRIASAPAPSSKPGPNSCITWVAAPPPAAAGSNIPIAT